MFKWNVCGLFLPLIQCELDRLTEQWNAHKIRKFNHSLVFEIPNELYFFPESQVYEQCGKNIRMAKVNEVVNESNVHPDLQGIQTTSKPDLVNYFNYLLQASNEFYQPTTWEIVKKLYQYVIGSAALV